MLIQSDKKILLAICGFIGSGKDTAAEYFVKHHGFRRDSFASPLKDAVSSIFGWDRELLEGLTPEHRKWREQIDPWWADRLNMPHLTPRWVLQYWGTEVGRFSFHNDIWIASLENRLRQTTSNIVISDVRFPNEIDAIQNAGGIVLRIKRGEDPIWFNDAVTINQASTNSDQWKQSKENLDKLGIHLSETSWVGRKLDFTIENNESIEKLFVKLEKFLKDLELNRLVSKANYN